MTITRTTQKSKIKKIKDQVTFCRRSTNQLLCKKCVASFVSANATHLLTLPFSWLSVGKKSAKRDKRDHVLLLKFESVRPVGGFSK